MTDTTTLPIPSGSTACSDCGGLAGAPLEEVVSWYAHQGSVLGIRENPAGAVFRFGRDPNCAVRRSAGEAMLRAHDKGVRHALGDWQYATEQLDGALVCLELMEADAATVDALTRTDAALLKLIRALGPLGRRATWRSKFEPVVMPGTSEAIYWQHRWGFLTRDLVEPIADAYLALIREHFEKPVLMPPPDDGTPRACLICGVGWVSTQPSKLAQAWGPIRRAPVSVLGGYSGAVIEGHLCPEDQRELGTPEVWSISLLDRSLMRFLGAPAFSEYEIDNARAWCVDLPRPEPTSKRFEFLGDLSDLREQLHPENQVQKRRYIKVTGSGVL